MSDFEGSPNTLRRLIEETERALVSQQAHRLDPNDSSEVTEDECRHLESQLVKIKKQLSESKKRKRLPLRWVTKLKEN